MAVLFIAPAIFVYVMEGRGNPKLAVAGVSQTATATQAGGNLEGKEFALRHGRVRRSTPAAVTDHLRRRERLGP